MTALRYLLALGVFAGFCVCAVPAQDNNITLTRVKYDGLKQEILNHRGKVVVVDFWATFCPPCVKSFPHFIDMQTKYADKGLVVISVSLDATDNPESIERAHAFLIKKKSPLRNFILDEPVEVWSKKFGSSSLPFYYVFDRRGKWVRLSAATLQPKERSEGRAYCTTTWIRSS